jgi:uncharacterized protein (TIGR03643 family)
MSVADDHDLTPDEVSRVISMAWEDDVPFAAIEQQFGLDEEAVIDLMRQELKPSSWRLWRERVQNRPTKHAGKDTLSGSTSRRPPTGRPPDDPDALDLPPDAR